VIEELVPDTEDLPGDMMWKRFAIFDHTANALCGMVPRGGLPFFNERN
jgi:hypothetical protein